MVLTRSQTSDSPRKAPPRKTPRKSRTRKSDESSSDEECTIELGDIGKSLAENLGTIFEEGEESASPLKPMVKGLAKWDQKQMAVETNGGKSSLKTLAPIQEESDCDTSEAELMTESEKDSQSTIEELPEIAQKSSANSAVDSKQSSTKVALSRNRFYFPPPTSLLPPTFTSTSIDTGMEVKDTYIDMKSVQKGRKKITDLYSIPATSTADMNMRDCVISPDFEARHAVPAEKSIRQQRKDRKAARSESAGKEWFNLKPPEMTEEVKRDLEILQMRGILDPKRFYKHNDRKTLPKYFQIGRIMDSPVDFYSSRVPKKQRKANLTEELLADAEFRQYQKRKYNEIQIKQKARGEKRRRMKFGKFSKRNKEPGS